MESLREEPQMNTKMSLPSPNTIPALEVKKKTQQMNKSKDLQSIYLQQFKWYPLPLVPLRQETPICWLPQPSQLNYNLIPLLEEQACQAEDHQEEEVVVEALQEEEVVHQEVVDKVEAMPNQPNRKESPWAHYQQFLKEIAQKLRVSSESSPHTS